MAAMNAPLPVVAPSGDALVHGSCPHDCPDTCAWTIRVTAGRAVELRGDGSHPFTQGGLCAKVNHYLDDRVYNPDRVLHPLRRTGEKGSGRFEQVGWEEALADIGSRLRTVVDEHGGEAVLPYSYVGNQGVLGMSGLAGPFFAGLRASRLDRTVCGDTGGTGLAAVNGSAAGIDPEDIALSRFVILWGTNTIQTNLHLWPFVRQAREDGATIVVIDPLRSRTAQASDWHVRPLPGSDAALALGMLRVIVDEGLFDAAFLAAHAVGFDALRERLTDYPLARCAKLTGLDAAEIAELARHYAGTRPATIRTLVGLEHHDNGAEMFRAIACLPVVTGAWRDRGGGLLSFTGDYLDRSLNRAGLDVPPDPAIRSVNMLELGRALTDLRPPIRALVVWSSNPAATAPNQNLVLAGLRRDDLFTVVHEHFLTDTARHADYVLPATTAAEHLDLTYSWGTTYLQINLPAIAAQGEAVPNTELFRRLAAAVGLDDPRFGRSDEAMVRGLLESDHPLLDGITFDRLVADGWAKLRLPDGFRPYADGFATDDGRAHLWSKEARAAGFDPLPGHVVGRETPAGDPDLAARYPLILLTAKTGLHLLNSSYSGVARHLRAEGDPRLDISAEDAAQRGITDGDVVTAFNDRGRVVLAARVGDRVRPGVVAMPSGRWASETPGGQAANALTSDGLDPWGRGGGFHDTLVDVAAHGTPSAL